MVLAYLNRIKDKFVEEQLDINIKISKLETVYKENVEFIKLLEENSDSNFDVFTPRTYNTFEKKKIEELKKEQGKIERDICDLKESLNVVENNIDEVLAVIEDAKEKLQ